MNKILTIAIYVSLFILGIIGGVGLGYYLLFRGYNYQGQLLLSLGIGSGGLLIGYLVGTMYKKPVIYEGGYVTPFAVVEAHPTVLDAFYERSKDVLQHIR